MPLSKKGKSILRDFIERYGAERGKEIFFAKENKDAKFRRAVKGKHKK